MCHFCCFGSYRKIVVFQCRSGGSKNRGKSVWSPPGVEKGSPTSRRTGGIDGGRVPTSKERGFEGRAKRKEIKHASRPNGPANYIIIEYAMRRDTAAPHFEQVPFRGMRLFEVDCVMRNDNSSVMFSRKPFVCLVLCWFWAALCLFLAPLGRFGMPFWAQASRRRGPIIEKRGEVRGRKK